jgi:hypothetical protein
MLRDAWNAPNAPNPLRVGLRWVENKSNYLIGCMKNAGSD